MVHPMPGSSFRAAIIIWVWQLVFSSLIAGMVLSFSLGDDVISNRLRDAI